MGVGINKTKNIVEPVISPAFLKVEAGNGTVITISGKRNLGDTLRISFIGRDRKTTNIFEAVRIFNIGVFLITDCFTVDKVSEVVNSVRIFEPSEKIKGDQSVFNNTALVHRDMGNRTESVWAVDTSGVSVKES